MEAFKVLPMSIDILPVNRALQARDEFRHWEYRYDQLKQFSSAECAAFDGQKKVEQTGIHIHWNLPREFRTDNVKVPNRYLVAVMDEEDRSVNGWVIESDSCSSGCPAETKAGLADGRGSQYQQGGCIMEIGSVYPMETWKETHSDKERADLTATAPGNALFSQYTPQNQNVFSMRYTPKKEKGTFRYLVVGWYAEQPGQPLCCGRVCHVQWDLDGTVPSQDPLEQLCDSGCLRLAIGASSTQALEALLTEQLKDINENSGAQVANIQAQLITAAYSDGITLLNQPGSEVLLAEKEHNDTFIARNSGTRFVNAVRGSDEEKKNAGSEMDKANRLQAQLDESRLQYEALSKKLLSLWWKRGHFPDFPPVPGHTREDFAPFFQGDSQDSLLYKTVYQALKTQALQKEKELLRVEGLREIPAQRFFQVQNPVMLILGVTPPKALETSESQDARMVDGINEIYQGIPAGPAALVTEFISQKPGEGENEAVWTMQWEPMLLEWRVQYVHVPLMEGQKQNWVFDGNDYRLRHDIPIMPGKAQEYSGIVPLSLHVREQAKDRLETLLGETLKDIPMLSQELMGLSDMMTQMDIRSFHKPHQEFMQVGNAVVDLGELFAEADQVPLMNWDVLTEFYGMQSGQMCFRDIILYDKFGRVLNLIRSEAFSGLKFSGNFHVAVHPSMVPDIPLLKDQASPIELRPRFLQPTRIQAAMKELAGYICLNYLNGALNFYLPDGVHTGEVALFGEKPEWRPSCMGGGCRTREEFSEKYSCLYELAVFLERMTESEFTGFLEANDTMLYHLDTDIKNAAKNALFYGSPMALTKWNLSHVYCGEARKGQGWQDTFRESQPEYTTYPLAVRMGQLEDPGDGFFACFPEDMSKVVTVKSDYQDKDAILIPGSQTEGVNVVMLSVPDRVVHAFTGVLPVKELEIPAEAVKGLEQIEAVMQAGPVISAILPDDQEKDGKRIRIMPVCQKEGVWTWQQQEPEGRMEYKLSETVSARKEVDGEFALYEGSLLVRQRKEG